MAELSLRAGAYIRQATGYRAFIPRELPPDPPIIIDDQLLELLSMADRALGRLDGSTETLPNPDLFVLMYVRKEALLSSQIEGTQASLAEVLELEAQVLDANQPTDANEVVNYINAMNYGLDRLKTLPVSLRLIREIHERIMTNTRGGEKHPGEFRRSQNWIGSTNSSIATAKFVPPPPHEMSLALSDLEGFLHDPRPMPALIKVGLAHAQFETIHPFLDGNGRVGRLLITFLLCQQNILKRPLLYLSYFFKQNRTEYYERLQAIRDHGDWEGWLKFFLQGVYEVAQSATSTARKIVNLRESHRSLVQEHGKLVANSIVMLDRLYHRPVVTVSSVADLLDIRFPNAANIVKVFEDLGILHEISGKARNRVYLYHSYFSLFNDEEVTFDREDASEDMQQTVSPGN